MTSRAALGAVLVLAAGLAGPALGQTTTTQGQDGSVIQMQPLNALKPQPQVPSVGAQQPLNALKPQPAVPDTTGTTGTTGTQLQPLDPNQQPYPGQPAPVGQPPATTDQVAPAVVPGDTTTTTTTADVAEAPGGVVRWLDKISGNTVDLTLKRGESKTEGRLTVTLDDCRYPIADPASNAYAYLTIRDKAVSKPIFKGWMIASSPALNPLDSARYDVWVLRCSKS